MERVADHCVELGFSLCVCCQDSMFALTCRFKAANNRELSIVSLADNVLSGETSSLDLP